MFDIAWSEMVLIGAVALVVIGPKDLPKVLRTVGQTIGKVRRMATEFQGQFNEAMREAELADLKKKVEDVGGSVSDSFNTDYKPIEQPKEFHAPSTAETAATAEAKSAEEKAAEEAALKQAEAKLADLPMSELPPVDIAAETPTPAAEPVPAAKPKRARKAKAEDDAAAPEDLAEAPAEAAAPRPAGRRSVKVVADAPLEADSPFPEASEPAKPARKRKPKADPAESAAETKNQENSA